MLLDRHGKPLRLTEALFWAATWGVGTASGVAAGAWLTVVGGSGAPGIEGLAPITDLVVLPLLALGTVTGVHLACQVVASALRGRAVSGGERQDAHQ